MIAERSLFFFSCLPVSLAFVACSLWARFLVPACGFAVVVAGRSWLRGVPLYTGSSIYTRYCIKNTSSIQIVYHRAVVSGTVIKRINTCLSGPIDMQFVVNWDILLKGARVGPAIPRPATLPTTVHGDQ
jgi:hypothetical protein